MKKISAIILAAGLGSRIGQPKWQLIHQGQTFLSIIFSKLCQLSLHEIVCVARRDSLPANNEIKIVVNLHPEYGMISSVYYGVNALEKVDGYLIFPVDHPFISEQTLKCLTDMFYQQRDKVICPRYQQLRGHPIIIPASVAKAVLLNNIENGLKTVIAESGVEVVDVNTDDTGILKNINTPDDL